MRIKLNNEIESNDFNHHTFFDMDGIGYGHGAGYGDGMGDGMGSRYGYGNGNGCCNSCYYYVLLDCIFTVAGDNNWEGYGKGYSQ